MSITKISPSVVDFDDSITISTADNTSQLILTSTDADANVGPVLELYRNSSSPADNDVLGTIFFYGEDGAGNKTEYARIESGTDDVSNGAEAGSLTVFTNNADTLTNNRFEINSTGLVINESSGDFDFRVESNGNANMLFVDAGNDRVGIGVQPSGATFHVVSSGSGVKARFSDNTSETLDIGITSDSHAYFNQPNSGPIAFEIGGSEVARFTSNGLAMTNTKGIDFSATGDGSGTDSSELLDDYEEGTWTPVLSGLSTAGTFSAGTGTAGRYIKIGKLCYVAVSIRNSTLSSASGTLKISGLPYATYDNNLFSMSSALMMHNFDFNINRIQAFYAANDFLYGIESIDGGAWTDWGVTNSSALYLQMTCMYEVDE